MTYSGSGDEVVKFKKALSEPTPMLITTTWRGGDDNNTIYAYDADGNEGDLLVNTIGSYKGTNIINLDDGDNVKALKIFSGLKMSSDHRRPFNRQLRPAEGWPSCNSSR